MEKKNIIKSIISILVIFVLYYVVVGLFFTEMSEKALFGDTFGGINAFFSSLAFIGVIYTIILQREELRLQRKELELTREELKKTAEAQEKSEQALCEQVDSMEKTAELNGLNSILQYLGSSLVAVTTGIHPDVSERDKIQKEAEKIKQKIKEMIEI